MKVILPDRLPIRIRVWPFAAELCRMATFPETTFYKEGCAKIVLERLPALITLLEFCVHAYLCYKVYSLAASEWHGPMSLGLLAFGYWILDFRLIGAFAPEPLYLIWRRMSLMRLLDWIFAKILCHRLTVQFDKQHILITKAFANLPYWRLWVNRSDVIRPTGSAYGFIVRSKLPREGIPQDHKVVCLFAGDAPITLCDLYCGIADMFQYRCQGLLRGEINAADFSEKKNTARR